MEEFGGGGHLMTAGAQPDISPEEVVEKLKEILIKKE
jgi:c-di-AMP phosphodiesterase-like protein